MNVSPPKAIEDFADDQVGGRGCSTSSEHVREPICKDLDLQRLHVPLLEAAASQAAVTIIADCFDRLRGQVRDAGQQ